MKDLTRAQRVWAARRYRPVVVQHRTAIHFGIPGRPLTLCMRRPLRAAMQGLDGTQVCVVCRQAARVAYEMRVKKVPVWGSARRQGGVL